MAELTVTSENFKEEVLDSTEDVLVDFFATWCGPCKMLSPILSEIASEGTKVCRIDVDEQPELADKYRIEAIPAIFAFRGGKVLNKHIGYADKKTILNLLK